MSIACASTARAQQDSVRDTTRAVQVQGITVIGTSADQAGVRARIRETPGSVGYVDAPQIRATRQANLTDVLRLTPGVFVQSRFGAADESQISIRGSGLRSNFHLRGLNILVNGMPYRNADGFSDFESLELLTAENVQVWKGGNALRYGGSTLGGGINIETKTGYSARPLLVHADAGSFGFVKAQASTGGTRGAIDWYASYARTQVDGYRDWAGNSRDRVNLHAGWVLSPRLDLRTFILYANVREHLPGSLTRAEMDADPTQAVANNRTNRWGRDYQLYHAGVQLRATMSDHGTLEVAPYFQYRDIDHPIFEVIAQSSRDGGVEARYENTAPLGSRHNRITLGAQLARGGTSNRQYANNGGSHGALTKDQLDVAGTHALFAEDVLALGGGLSAVLGVRYESSLRRTTDHFLSDGDQTGSRTFSALLPKAGLLYDLPGNRSQLFANVSRSFEPPLLLEMNAFHVAGAPPLEAQSAWQAEIGTRGRGGRFQWDVALYDVELTNELTNLNVQPFPGAPFTVPTYRNIRGSRHYGLETSLGIRLGALVRAQVAYTYAVNQFSKDSLYDGNRIPGAPSHYLTAELFYLNSHGFSITPRVDWVPQKYFVNNANSASNDAWIAFGARAEYMIGARLRLFGEVRNIADATYSASVQVNDDNGRYFEPADRRSFSLGMTWQR